jgi:polar amino acid transport system permease protein
VTGLDRFIETFFNPVIIAKYFPAILQGLLVTVELSVLVVVSGLALGLVLAFVRALAGTLAAIPIVVFADVARAVPPLVLILLVYFGLPNVGVTLSGFVVVWLVLALVLVAFAEEIFWAGITSVRRGQWEAARSTGLSRPQTIAWVVMPQAVRLTIPPLTNRTIAIVKNTALGTVVGVGEILNQATTAQSFSGNASPLIVGALVYVALFVPVVYAGRRIERRYTWSRA